MTAAFVGAVAFVDAGAAAGATVRGASGARSAICAVDPAPDLLLPPPPLITATTIPIMAAAIPPPIHHSLRREGATRGSGSLSGRRSISGIGGAVASGTASG